MSEALKEWRHLGQVQLGARLSRICNAAHRDRRDVFKQVPHVSTFILFFIFCINSLYKKA